MSTPDHRPPHQAGPHHAGPDTAGPDTAGPHHATPAYPSGQPAGPPPLADGSRGPFGPPGGPFGSDLAGPPPAPAWERPAPSRRRGPGWGALVGTAVGAALLASGGTAVLTGALDDTTSAPAGAVGQVEEEPAPADGADPVVRGAAAAPDWVELAATVGPTVVAIDVRTAGGSGSGSGVIVSEDGRIVSNHHVVGGAVRGGIVVTLSDGRKFPATIEGTDPQTDLAVITLDDPPDDLQAASLGDSEAVRVGDPVAAIGNPLGLSHTVTTGIVSALDRPVSTVQAAQSPGQQGVPVFTNAIQVDAPINPGNSGGPLFDAAGRVIGINSSIASLSSGAGGQAGSIGLGFAIPSNLVDLIAEQLIAEGVAEHAYLGVVPANALATTGGETRAGAGVESVEPGSPADTAGVRPGDVILRVGDDYATGAESLIGLIRQYASGEAITLTVARDGESVELEATLATREDQLP